MARTVDAGQVRIDHRIGQRLPIADTHFLLATAAAGPVWWVLATGIAGPLYQPAGISAWLVFVCWQPISEELVFRGALQGQLLRLWGRRPIAGITLANATSTALFVALHLPVQPLLWALLVAGPSLVLGHLRERLGRLWPVVVLHVFYNAGFGVAARMAG